MLRLGFQGVELLTTGRLSLPMREPERSFLLDVRRGKVSADLAIALRDEIEGGGHPRCAARVVGLLASCIGTISEMAVEDTLALGVTAYRAQAGEQ